MPDTLDAAMIIPIFATWVCVDPSVACRAVSQDRASVCHIWAPPNCLQRTPLTVTALEVQLWDRMHVKTIHAELAMNAQFSRPLPLQIEQNEKRNGRRPCASQLIARTKKEPPPHRCQNTSLYELPNDAGIIRVLILNVTE